MSREEFFAAANSYYDGIRSIKANESYIKTRDRIYQEGLDHLIYSISQCF